MPERRAAAGALRAAGPLTRRLRGIAPVTPTIHNIMEKTLFQKICDREIPADIVYEDDEIVAFRDIAPQAPTHVLLVPRKPIPRVGEAEEADQAVLGRLLWRAGRLAADLGLANGFRLVINNGPDGGEAVPHLHVHLLGGRQLAWPPG